MFLICHGIGPDHAAGVGGERLKRGRVVLR